MGINNIGLLGRKASIAFAQALIALWVLLFTAMRPEYVHAMDLAALNAEVDALAGALCTPAGPATLKALAAVLERAAEQGHKVREDLSVCEVAEVQIRAGALLDRAILVGKAWAATASEDELRFVLAHELGHIQAKHGEGRMLLTHRLSGKHFASSDELAAAVRKLGPEQLDALRQMSWDAEYAADQFALEVTEVSPFAVIRALGGSDVQETATLSHPATADRVARLFGDGTAHR